METVETSLNLGPTGLAEALMKQHAQKNMRIISLVGDVGPNEGPVLKDAIRLLEKRGDVYVERHPCQRDGAIRSDLQSTDVVYFDTFPCIERRTLLYKTAVEYGDFTINHVLGCFHGCKYPCYAMQMSKRYGRISDYDDWMHPRIVGNAMDLLERELERFNGDIQFVHLSFMTDPFMYDPVNERNLPWVEDLTTRIIARLNHDGIKTTVLTKGIYPDVLVDELFSKDNEYGITLVSMNSDFHQKYEPFSPVPKKRLKALRKLSDAGLKTWVSLEPYPTPNIAEQDLMELLEKISFANKIIFGKWNYNPDVNGYVETKRFYTECSDLVIKFCKKNKITLHIKEHTPRSNNDTKDLFVDT